MPNHRNRHGISAPEVSAVCTILGAFALLVSLSHRDRQAASRVSRIYSDLRIQKRGVEAYYADWGIYPRSTYGYLAGNINVPPELQFTDTVDGLPGGRIMVRTLPYSVTTPVAYLSHLPIRPGAESHQTGLTPPRDFYFYQCHRTERIIGTLAGISMFEPGGLQHDPLNSPELGRFARLLGEFAFHEHATPRHFNDFGTNHPELLSLNLALYYDPTNGTASKGVIVVSEFSSPSSPRAGS